MRYKMLCDDGQVLEEELDSSISEQISVLPYDEAAYFEVDASTVAIPLNMLISTRARAKGIVNACALMRLALEGKGPRRLPLTVSAHSDSAYIVDDGNSTLMNARYSGWPDIPCNIVPIKS